MATRTAKGSRSTPVRPAPKPGDEGSLSPTPPARQPLSADEIRVCAYLRWEAAGKPPGDGAQFWLEAEQELLQRK
jgi:hypothetical protein